MKRRGMLGIIAIVLVLVSVIAMSCGGGGETPTATPTIKPGTTATQAPVATTPSTETGTVKIGLAFPLTGLSAIWGISMVDSIGVYLDDYVNPAGGVNVGGKMYKVETVTYDHEDVSSIAVSQARKLIYEDKVTAIITSWADPPLAMAPICTENKIPELGCNFQFGNGAEVPYYLGVELPTPHYMMAGINYVAKAHPEYTKIAIVTQDDAIGRITMAWSKAMAQSLGLDVVLYKAFPLDTIDFAPIATQIVASGAQIYAYGTTYGDYQPYIFEELKLRGWDGVATGDELVDTPALLQRLGPEFMEGFTDGMPLWNDPELAKISPFFNEFYNKMEDKVGPWFNNYMAGPLYLSVWQYGVEKAGTFDGEAVLNALTSSETMPHLYGEAYWWGEKIYGGNNQLVYPNPVAVIMNGEKHLAEWWDFGPWWDKIENQKLLAKALHEENFYVADQSLLQ